LGHQKKSTEENPKNHFIKRASKYDSSSAWVNDAALVKEILVLAEVECNATVLDVAIGTGKIAGAFYKNAKYVIGLDICSQMLSYAKKATDAIVISNAENMPFKNNSFDICVCRQGLQFMGVDKALSEMYRVLKPSGRVVLCHLTAYNETDRDLAFFIQKLRNPARKNFFMPQDFAEMLKRNNFTDIKLFEYITKESVNRWIENSAISEEAKERIKETYIKAPEDFMRIHDIQFKGGDIFDSMMMTIVTAQK
jgi:DNA gyrase subunit B